MRVDTNNAFAFDYYNGSSWSAQMTLDASGNLGLGVTPSYQFDLLTPTSATDRQAVRINYGTSVGRALYFGIDAAVTGTTYIQSATPSSVSSGTDLALNPKGGNLGVGTASPQLNTNSGTFTTIYNASSSAWLELATGSTTDGFGGSVTFNNTNRTGTDKRIAQISGIRSGANDTGYLAFITWNAGTGAESARFTSGGYFKASNNGTYQSATDPYHEFNNTANGNPILRLANSNATGPYGVQIRFTGAAPDNNTEYFLNCADNAAGGTNRLFIYSDGDVLNHDGTYGTISDERLKRDIIDATSQWDDIKAIRFRKYRFKSDVEVKGEDAPYMLGVVAQELEQTSPGLVDEHPDFEEQDVEDEDGNVTTERVQVGTTKSVKSSILLMKAAVALQEAMARIEALEARLEALEA